MPPSAGGSRAVPEDPFREVAVAIAGGRISVGMAGSGEPVLALHGLTASRAVWRPLARRLPPGTRLLAPDLPGRGRSPPADSGRYRLRDELRRLRSLLERMEVAPRVAVGHSHGASLAVALASTTPSLRGLALCNPVCPWTPRPPLLDRLPAAAPVARRLVPALRRPVTRWVLRRRVYADPTRADGNAVRRYAEPWGDPDRAEELTRVLADWKPAAMWPYLPPPPGPVRVLAAAGDRRVPPRDAARLARAAGAGLTVVSDAAHGLPEERPDLVAAAVSELLRDLRGRTAARAGDRLQGNGR